MALKEKSLAPSKPTNIPNPGAASKDPFSWSATRDDTINVANMGLSSPTLTGAQAFQEIEKMAYQNPSQWAKIKVTLAKMLAYNEGKPYTKSTLPNFNGPWSKEDAKAVEWALTQYHNVNYDPKASASPTPSGITGTTQTKPSFLSFATDAATHVKNNGYLPTAKAATVISLPAKTDLAKVAQDAFTKTLGRQPTDQEQADFSNQFQNLVLSYGQAKNDAKHQSSLPPPGATPSSVPSAVAVEQPPSADVAATNFALKADPAQAASNGLDDAMSSWFSTLEKGVGK